MFYETMFYETEQKPKPLTVNNKYYIKNRKRLILEFRQQVIDKYMINRHSRFCYYNLPLFAKIPYNIIILKLESNTVVRCLIAELLIKYKLYSSWLCTMNPPRSRCVANPFG